jgi:hypothetical protein
MTEEERSRCRVHQQAEMAQEVDTQDGKLDCGEKECPLETATAERKLQPPLAPTRYVFTGRPAQQGAIGGFHGLVRINRKGSTSVNQKTPSRNLVRYVN